MTKSIRAICFRTGPRIGASSKLDSSEEEFFLFLHPIISKRHILFDLHIHSQLNDQWKPDDRYEARRANL